MTPDVPDQILTRGQLLTRLRAERAEHERTRAALRKAEERAQSAEFIDRLNSAELRSARVQLDAERRAHQTTAAALTANRTASEADHA